MTAYPNGLNHTALYKKMITGVWGIVLRSRTVAVALERGLVGGESENARFISYVVPEFSKVSSFTYA
jgi:hypothetical protein